MPTAGTVGVTKYELPPNIRPKSGMFGDCSNFIDNLDRQINKILGGKNGNTPKNKINH